MARVLVLGGGFGGIATAVALRQKLHTRDEVVLVDRRQDFAMGIRKTWHILGISPIAYGTRQLSTLGRRGITVMQGEITAIDPSARNATIDREVVEADVLVVALGASHAMAAIPGLVEYGFSAWSRDVIEHAHAAVDGFPGGRVVVGITGQPYSCPPAPFELALLAADRFEERGVDARVTVFGPAPTTLPLLDRSRSWLRWTRALADRDIGYLGIGGWQRGVGRGEVSFAAHEPLEFDLLLAVPRIACHRCSWTPGWRCRWMGRGRFANAGDEWPGVYAIGDCTAIGLSNGMSAPKAGLFAEREGEVIAERIAATWDGETPRAAFDGAGACFVELGARRGERDWRQFFADPPRATLAEPEPRQRGGKGTLRVGAADTLVRRLRSRSVAQGQRLCDRQV